MDAPSFTKPAHGYGQPFGQVFCPEEPDGVLAPSQEDLEWAGPGFTVRNDESTT